MIEYEFRREPDHNYLIPDINWEEQDEYSIHMITENTIPGYLHVKAERMNGMTTLCYEVTSLQSIEVIFARRGMGEKDIRAVLKGILLALDNARDYLLSYDNVIFHPSFIYMDPESGMTRLCYIPGYGREEKQDEHQLLAEFILRHLNHEDHGAVDLGYGFYEQICRKKEGLSAVVRRMAEQQYISAPQADFPGASEGMARRKGIEAGDAKLPGEAETKNIDRDDEYKLGRSLKSNIELDTEENYDQEEPIEEIKGRHVKNHKKRGRKQRTAHNNRGQKTSKTKSKPGTGGKKKYIPWVAAGLLAAILYILIILIFSLDLTQMGGLAFLFIALFWLIYGTVSGNRKREHNPWATEEENQEDAFMEQLMSEIHQTGDQEEELIWQNSKDISVPESEADFPLAEKETGRDGVGRQTAGYRSSGQHNIGRRSSEQQTFGQTRILRMQEGPNVTLVSENIRYPNMKVLGEECLIGKQANNVDLVLPPHDALSRIHAKLECNAEGIFLTDMNSANGTRVNDVLITQRTEVHAGDRISFAGFHYIVRVE